MGNAFYESLPKKRMATGAVFQNERSDYLLVKPHYKDYWTLPGGVLESEESPMSGCKREVTEEIGLNRDGYQLLCVAYLSKEPPKTERVHFIFYGGVLTEQETMRITLQESEIEDCRFFDLSETLERLDEQMSQRMRFCCEALKRKEIVYLEDQRVIEGLG